MREQFLEIVENLRTVDFSQAPIYKTILAFAKHPEAYYPYPEQVAAQIKINVNENFVNDTELFNTTVDVYVKCLNRLYDQLKQDFPNQDIRMFEKMVASMQLSLTYTA